MKLLFIMLFIISCGSKQKQEVPPTTPTPPATKTEILPFEAEWVGKGVNYRSEDHPDSVFVIEAFGNLCEPCNENAKNVEDLAFVYSEDPSVQVLDLGTDKDADQYEEWIARHNPKHPVLKDNDSRDLIKLLKIKKTPTLTIVGCDGKIVYQSVGKWTDEMKAKIYEKVDTVSAVCLQRPLDQPVELP